MSAPSLSQWERELGYRQALVSLSHREREGAREAKAEWEG